MAMKTPSPSKRKKDSKVVKQQNEMIFKKNGKKTTTNSLSGNFPSASERSLNWVGRGNEVSMSERVQRRLERSCFNCGEKFVK